MDKKTSAKQILKKENERLLKQNEDLLKQNEELSAKLEASEKEVKFMIDRNQKILLQYEFFRKENIDLHKAYKSINDIAIQSADKVRDLRDKLMMSEETMTNIESHPEIIPGYQNLDR